MILGCVGLVVCINSVISWEADLLCGACSGLHVQKSRSQVQILVASVVT